MAAILGVREQKTHKTSLDLDAAACLSFSAGTSRMDVPYATIASLQRPGALNPMMLNPKGRDGSDPDARTHTYTNTE